METSSSIEGWHKTFLSQIVAARQLGCTPADEHEPYKNSYAAADALKQLQGQLQQLGSGDGPAAYPTSLLIAWCRLEQGLQLLETDLLAEGHKALEEGLKYAWPDTVECLAIQLQAHNALASLWCERSENDTALQHLQSATDLYNSICQLQSKRQQQQQDEAGAVAAQPGAAGQQQAHAAERQCRQQSGQQQDAAELAAAPTAAATDTPDGAASSPPAACISSWQAELVDADQIERDHTTTLFYMAQVYGLMGDKMQSASYCAATLNRQLKQGDLDLNEWVQNCLQLSGCFLDCNTFALSKHCCAAVEAMLLQQYQQRQQQLAQQEASDTSCSAQDRDTAGQPQQQQLEQQQDKQERVSSSSSQDQLDSKDQAAKQKDPNSKQQQQQGDSVPGGPSGPLLAALSLLDDDVAANVCLAFAKLHLYNLVASHEAVLEGKRVQAAFSSAAEVPAVLCFDALPGLPALASLAWGPDALARTYDQALQLFKAALPWFKRALEHYQLDGWVTEHCNILFEMSNLYRCLAGFEVDPHKRCVMHRSRTKLLQPLEGQLSTTHYPGLSRSISLELGNIFREVADIKSAAGREPDKVAAAMQSAADHYKLFLDSFKDESGALPDRVDPDMEQHYLSGMFSMARMLQGMPGTGTLGSVVDASKAAGPDKAGQELQALEQATVLLGSLVKYVRQHKVEDWQEQADMADELASLLQEKIDLVRSVQQMQIAA